jgi:hypothetical protein
MHNSVIRACRFCALVLLLALIGISCGGNDPSLEGVYKGSLAMEDGTKTIKLELMEDKKARLTGLYDESAEGTWKEESVGEGFDKDGIFASFEFPAYEIKFKLLTVKNGFQLMNFSARRKGDPIHRSVKLRKTNPKLRRIR